MFQFLLGLWILFCVFAMTFGLIYLAGKRVFQRITGQQTSSANMPLSDSPVHVANRNMQVALLQLRERPDFRHAASEVAKAQAVPLYFRQRQYQRFRGALLDRFAELLANGARSDDLIASLRQLVVALGMGEQEAEYIRHEADQRHVEQGGSAAGLAGQLQKAQAAYQQRIRAIKGMKDLDTEIREQLLEQERVRFEERMRRLTGGSDGDEDQ